MAKKTKTEEKEIVIEEVEDISIENVSRIATSAIEEIMKPLRKEAKKDAKEELKESQKDEVKEIVDGKFLEQKKQEFLEAEKGYITMFQMGLTFLNPILSKANIEPLRADEQNALIQAVFKALRAPVLKKVESMEKYVNKLGKFPNYIELVGVLYAITMERIDMPKIKEILKKRKERIQEKQQQ